MAKLNVAQITSGIHEKMYRVYFERYVYLSERAVELFHALEDVMVLGNDGETYEIDPNINGDDDTRSLYISQLNEAYATLNEANQVFAQMNELRRNHLNDVGFHFEP